MNKYKTNKKLDKWERRVGKIRAVDYSSSKASSSSLDYFRKYKPYEGVNDVNKG